MVKVHISVLFIIIDIRDLADVIQELTLIQQFNYTDWYQLGLYLGLYEPTLRAIEQDYINVKDCLMECIAAWLKRVDSVERVGGGGPSWLSLVLALDKMGNYHTAANIRKYTVPTLQ